MNDRLDTTAVSGVLLDQQVEAAVLTPFGQMLRDMDVAGLIVDRNTRPYEYDVGDLRSNQLESIQT